MIDVMAIHEQMLVRTISTAPFFFYEISPQIKQTAVIINTTKHIYIYNKTIRIYISPTFLYIP